LQRLFVFTGATSGVYELEAKTVITDLIQISGTITEKVDEV